MTTEDFIIELFYRIDEELKNVEKHPQAKLYHFRFFGRIFFFYFLYHNQLPRKKYSRKPRPKQSISEFLVNQAQTFEH
jgi:hypothetical protein